MKKILIQLAAGAAAEKLVFGRIVEGGGDGEGSDFGKFHTLLERWEELRDTNRQFPLGFRLFYIATERATSIISESPYAELIRPLARSLVAEGKMDGSRFRDAFKTISEA